ncbi:MAG: PAS domain-containing protein [Pseudomonadota bacterium]
MTSYRIVALTEAQANLILYWNSLVDTADAPCPRRSAINPWHLGPALSEVSLLEVAEDGSARFRLAGTSVTELTGQSLKHVAVDALEGPFAGLWRLGVSDAVATLAPVHGRVEAAINGRDLAWLRLPLLDAEGRPRFVLCHDCWANSAQILHPEVVFIHGQNPSIAA